MSIEVVREQGKPTAVTWGTGQWRVRMVDGEPVAEFHFDTGWFGITCPDFGLALTAYKVLTEGMAPAEGFEVECEGERITEVLVRREGVLSIADTPIASLQGGSWQFHEVSTTAGELRQLAPILAEIAEQESRQNADA